MDYIKLDEFPNYLIYSNGMVCKIQKQGKNGNMVKKRELTPTKAKNGYRTVRLCDKYGNCKQFYLHRLVYTAFNGDIAKLEIDHIDGDRSHNNLNNLRAVCHRANCSNPISIMRYKIANALDKGKYDKERLMQARTKEYHEKLVNTYWMLNKEHGHCSICMLMKMGHCGYPRAKRIISELDGKNEIN